MDETLIWSDLRLFLAVAKAGGLAGAARATGLSPPTLGRRMAALETSCAVSLFRRHRHGYELTAHGLQLLQRADEVDLAVQAVERWREAAGSRSTVRVSAGYWTSRFLASRLAAFAGLPCSIALIPTAERLDLVRRAADIGLRNARPTEPGLAARRLGEVAFAIYGAPDLLRRTPEALDERRFSACPWLLHGDGSGAALLPSSRWLAQRVGGPVKLSSSHPGPILEAAAAGVGLCILPCFAGDAERRLARASPPIAELRHEQWLAVHEEGRHRPTVRAVVRGLAALWRRDAGVLLGGESRP